MRGIIQVGLVISVCYLSSYYPLRNGIMPKSIHVPSVFSHLRTIRERTHKMEPATTYAPTPFCQSRQTYEFKNNA